LTRDVDSDEWKLVELFAANLDRRMTLKGVNNSWLARMTNVSRQIVSQWRSAKDYPAKHHIESICVALQCAEEDLYRPLFVSNLIQIMDERAISMPALAALVELSEKSVLRWLNGSVPSPSAMKRLCQVLRCTEASLTGLPEIIPLPKWARREGIPLRRARDLFELGLLAGAINCADCVMIPASIVAPIESKQLVAMTKRRPLYGLAGWQDFAIRLKAIMRAAGVMDDVLQNATGVHPLTVYHWRTGKRTPEEDKLPMIAEVCKCRVEDFVGPEKKETETGLWLDSAAA
jgi:transcriptional regulator with XRE-family HTH domain